MGDQQLPVYIPVTDLAKMAGWTLRRTRDFVKASGIAVKRRGAILAPRERVRQEWPEVYEAWLDRFASGGE